MVDLKSNKTWMIGGIIALSVALILLVTLFMFLRLAFWIGLVIVGVLAGLWVYKFFENRKTVDQEKSSQSV